MVYSAGNIFRGVAQLGRVLGSGPRGRRFESSHSDHKNSQDVRPDCFLLQLKVLNFGFLQSRTNSGPRENKQKNTIRTGVFRDVKSPKQREAAFSACPKNRCDYATGQGCGGSNPLIELIIKNPNSVKLLGSLIL